MRKFLLVFAFLSFSHAIAARAGEPAPPPNIPAGATLVFGTLQNQEGKLALSPNGSRLVAMDISGSVTVYDAQKATQLKKFEAGGECASLEFGLNEKMIITAGPGTVITVWNAETGVEERKLEGSKGTLCVVTLSPDGTRLASTDQSGALRIWDFAAGKIIFDLKPSRTKDDPEAPYSEGLAFSPDGRFIVTEANDAKARVWDAVRGIELFVLPDHDGNVATDAISPDGVLAASTRGGGVCRLWRMDSGEIVRVISGHDDFITALTFAPDGRSILTASQDHTVRQWDVETGLELRRFGLNAKPVSLVCAPDGRSFYTLSDDRKVFGWSLREPPLVDFRDITAKQTLEAMWKALGNSDYEVRAQAINDILAFTDKTAATNYILERFGETKVSEADHAHQKALIAKLNEPQFTARDDAFNALKELKSGARASLLEALKDSQQSEVKHQVRQLLNLIGGTDETRIMLAVEIFGIMHTPEAKAALVRLASKDGSAAGRAKAVIARMWKD